MGSLKYARVTLLETVKKNRSQHEQDFTQAMAAYRRQMIVELKDKLANAMDEKDVQHHLTLPRPLNYLKEYDRTISMLEITTNSEIELTPDVFAQLVLDDWDWKQSFSLTNSSYGVGSSYGG
jgi:hypothetical protein